jgi:hypothetical protein
LVPAGARNTFLAEVTRMHASTKFAKWTCCPEASGFDIPMIRAALGFQLGIESEFSLSAAVPTQALQEQFWRAAFEGPG